MKIIKRNGSEAVFDISKIIAAVTKANNVVASNQRLTKEQITAIADDVAQECQSRNHAMNVEEIQDLVEDAIMQTKAYEVAPALSDHPSFLSALRCVSERKEDAAFCKRKIRL